ncbi:MMPL family transporter [Nocardia terpenica]|uniref:MMPL family transporter n=1 Tax=Nocardia terpenica TaxID=455432 RepID=UPI0018958542|nr:MMPL family transporter [Nocardia terpenica]MBF6062595.1 MMPL family transporter [Nocardia terpenica]MBF6104683.1 MMPL family transporter [Nocardia terpenica]MBF6116482.1 MMPL family transporter [Nocardia terpenica]MBF6123445.1 MMPL family transporter [Nocardia terpenica]MBF6156898.1 MMPL family transporter [Nocardia terpenica]
MLTRIAQFSVRYPRALLLGALVVALACGVFGASAAAHLKAGGFTPDAAESSRVSQLLADKFDGAQPNFVLLVSADQGVDSAPARQVGTALVDRLQARGDAVGVRSYWTSPPNVKAALRSTDGREGLVLAYLRGGDDQAQRAAGEIAAQLTGDTPGVRVHAGGAATVFHDVNKQVTRDLEVAEAVAIPLSMIVLVLVFGSVVAAALPLVVGIFAIAATLAILRLLTLGTDVSIYALNMTTAMGLALAIDYSLFIVSRYREELANGLPYREAAIRAVRTAGRTVLFSALTVALALAVLSVFPLYFLKSFAYSGVAVVLAAAAAAIVLLPAALVLLGARINAWDLRVPLRRLVGRSAPAPRDPEQTWWYRAVSGVMRRALPVGVVIVALLLALGSPFLGVKFGYPDDRVLPPEASSRVVGDQLRSEFPGANDGGATTIVLDGYHGDQSAVTEYATALSKVTGVSAVLSSSGVYVSGARMAATPPGMANDSGQYLTVASRFDPFSPDGKRQLEDLRGVDAPGPALFGGAAEMNNDALDAIGSRLPLAIGLIVLATFVVLFLFTGSVVLPVKALLLNTLSLAAAFGAMVWIFQEGHLSTLLGFTPVGYMVATMPLLMFCVAFGISMDYEVFLLSRIREAWLESGRTAADNTHAVAVGVARTGRIFTAAALLMAIVLGAMVSAKVSFIQLFGLGLTLTVLTDATLIRGMLAPALMRLLGTANWWAPAPLRRLHERFGFSEEPESVRVPESVGPR